jgi:flavin reductase (DIM6/NTAB) family NADH-FMN oxidoreductase RutF
VTGARGTGLLGTAAPAGAAVPRAAFLDSMAMMPSAVAVVTAPQADGTPCGLLATSVTSFSTDPASILVSVSRQARSHPAIVRGAAFGVHLLGRGQQGIARVFASLSDDKFAGLAWRQLQGVPVLDGCLVRMICTRSAHFSHADHTVVIGGVSDIMMKAGEPLVYFNRSMAWELARADA